MPPNKKINRNANSEAVRSLLPYELSASGYLCRQQRCVWRIPNFPHKPMLTPSLVMSLPIISMVGESILDLLDNFQRYFEKTQGFDGNLRILAALGGNLSEGGPSNLLFLLGWFSTVTSSNQVVGSSHRRAQRGQAEGPSLRARQMTKGQPIFLVNPFFISDTLSDSFFAMLPDQLLICTET